MIVPPRGRIPEISRGPSGCNVPQNQKIKPEVCAPGVNVFSSTPGNSYGNMSGTSMAGPHVAGVVGLIRDANPNIDVESIKGSSDILSRIFVLAPVRKKTVAQVLVDHAAVHLDDFLAARNPATDELGQFIAR